MWKVCFPRCCVAREQLTPDFSGDSGCSSAVFFRHGNREARYLPSPRARRRPGLWAEGTSPPSSGVPASTTCEKVVTEKHRDGISELPQGKKPRARLLETVGSSLRQPPGATSYLHPWTHQGRHFSSIHSLTATLPCEHLRGPAGTRRKGSAAITSALGEYKGVNSGVW